MKIQHPQDWLGFPPRTLAGDSAQPTVAPRNKLPHQHHGLVHHSTISAEFVIRAQGDNNPCYFFVNLIF